MIASRRKKGSAGDSERLTTDGRDYVSSFARGLEVIQTFTKDYPKMTLSEVAERAGMNRAAARRFLLTLVTEGFADFDGKSFSLNSKILDLGFSALASLSLPEIVQPFLNDLAQKLNEACFCVVLDGESSVYIAAARSRQMMTINTEVGGRQPAYCMSSGRVLLGSLRSDELDRILRNVKLKAYTPTTITSRVAVRKAIDDARVKGYSLVDQEYEIGLRSISVPIKDRGGTIIAALTVACPTPRFTQEEMREKILPELLESSKKVTASLAGRVVQMPTRA